MQTYYDLPSIPTTLSVQVPEDRDYSQVLTQTEIVYDQLLAERYHKLMNAIKTRYKEYADKYAELMSAGEHEKAEEFKRWSDTAFLQLKATSAHELQRLREDYENKYLRLWQSLEAQWQANLSYQ